MTEPDVRQWAPALTNVLGRLTGSEVSLASPPTPRLDPDGPWAFGFELLAADAQLPCQWQGPLIARVGDRLGELANEERVLTFCARRGIGVPRPLALVDLGMSLPAEPTPAATHALILRAPPLPQLPDVIQFNLTSSGELLGGFAAYHAAVHQLDPGDLWDELPVVLLKEELERIDGRQFASQLEWLQEHAPRPGPTVLCHGAYNPLCVAAPGPDQWKTDGGPGRGLVASGWAGAFLAEREADMAMTLAMFWLAPHFAPSRPARTAMRMVRNVLSNDYKTGYAAVAPVDTERLTYWQAFHALRGLARLAGAYDGDGSPFAGADRRPLPVEIAPELDRLYQLSIARAAAASR
ncbi:MAG: hypothetical protein J2P57_08660 [Acidimicrobiaceae bacterium]|nr:hypothetical protein [Acidimicrobiaceae bacterium]